MKGVIAVAAFFTLMSMGAFGFLIAADRHLGVSLPYSIPLAFAIPAALAPGMAALAHALRRRRPIVMQIATPRRPAASAIAARQPAVSAAPRQAQGVVLLDLSSVTSIKERVA